MSKIDEYKIEQYIRFAEELTEEEKNEVERLIETSDEMQAIYLFLKQFYEEFDKASRVSKAVIPLTLLQKHQHSGPVVLAAMTKESSASGLVTKATLVSEERKTVVRILEDEQSHSLQFHVIGNQKQPNSYVILSLLNPQVDLVTNEKGKLKGVQELSDIDWSTVSTLLRIPVFKTTVHPGISNKSFNVKNESGQEVEIQKYDEHVQIKVKNEGSVLSRVLVVQDKSSDLIKMSGQPINFELTDPHSKAHLYFYE
ncbi:hypothetical protein [Gracilimonas sediminicola]|uniref:Uncharacterized protein n=1 Tax=Gracilimonas sediminicola TaxID=2952158 RepID=A0A9X2RH70_9BACT|nr:hypothetical protein [Gracilimonas sediminicola]MCP9291479.1 hypothetical protein [Gracilimonas sediminicola]